MSAATAAHTLLAYQRDVLNLIRNDRAKVIVIEKSRRIGITWSLAMLAVIVAAAEENGSDVYYVNTNKEDTKEFVREVVAHMEHAHKVVLEVHEEHLITDDGQALNYEVRMPSGWRVVALSSQPRRTRGKKGLVILDEYAFADDADELLKSAIAVTVWGSKVVVCSTHNGVGSRFNRLCEDVRAKRLPYALVTIPFDLAVSQGLFKRIAEITREKWTADREAAWVAETYAEFGPYADEELRCIPSEAGSQYLGAQLVEQAMVLDASAVTRWSCSPELSRAPDAARKAAALQHFKSAIAPIIERLPSGVRMFLGFDYGRRVDLSCGALAWIAPGLVRRYGLVFEWRGLAVELQRYLLFLIIDALRGRIARVAMDATGPGAALAELCCDRYGGLIAPVTMTERFLDEAWPVFRGALEDRAALLPKDPLHLEDLCSVALVGNKPRIPKGNSSRKGEHRHADSAVAYLLGHWASRQGASGPVEYTAAPKRGPERQTSESWMRASTHHAGDTAGPLGGKRSGGLY